MVLQIRRGLAATLNYEDVAVLVKDPNSILEGGDQYFAISPNFLGHNLTFDSSELFFFNPPTSCLSISLQTTNTTLHAATPRQIPHFQDGIDNLSPVAYIRDIVYAPLAGNSGTVGILQLINKRRGIIQAEDIDVARDIGRVVGAFVSTTLEVINMQTTIDKIKSSFASI